MPLHEVLMLPGDLLQGSCQERLLTPTELCTGLHAAERGWASGRAMLGLMQQRAALWASAAAPPGQPCRLPSWLLGDGGWGKGHLAPSHQLLFRPLQRVVRCPSLQRLAGIMLEQGCRHWTA